MTERVQVEGSRAFDAGFDAGRQVTVADVDRLCTDCGFPLRGQPVRIEPLSRMPMCRCPNCGRYAPGDGVTAPSERVLRRVAVPLVVAWLLLVLGTFVVVGLATWLMHVVLLEAASNRPLDDFTLPILLVGLSALFAAFPTGMLSCAAAAGSWLRLTLAAAGACLVLIAVIEVTVAVWAKPRYSRSYSYNSHGQGHYLLWRYPLYAATLLGALLPVLLARPLGRWVIATFAPQSTLPYFSHLWTRDGLAVPGAAPAEP